MSPLDDQIEKIHRNFSTIYLGGIPAIITNDSAFLSFLCILSATEALAGYRYSDISKSGERFKNFVKHYFPKPYKALADNLWDLRNGLFHAFSPRKFLLMHHQSHRHLKSERGEHALNAEDFYAALVLAAQHYFDDLRSDSVLQGLFEKRLTDEQGGAITIGPVSKSIASRDGNV